MSLTKHLLIACCTAAALLEAATTPSSDLNIDKVLFWPGSRDFWLKLTDTSTASRSTPATVQVLEPSSQKVMSSVKITMKQNEPYIRIPAKSLAAGTWTIRLADEHNAILAQSTGTIPPPQTFPEGRLNNFVRILRKDAPATLDSTRALHFTNPRKGWVFFTLQSEQNGTVQFPKASGEPLELTAGQTVETMRFYPEGPCNLTSQAPVTLSHCDIRSVPELLLCEYEGMPSRSMFKPLMNSQAVKHFLKNANTILEGFQNAYTLDLETVTPEAEERIGAWRRAGLHVISHAKRFGADSKNPAISDSFAYWFSRIGSLRFDGVAIDEFGNETADELPFYTAALEKKIFDSKYRPVPLYAYSCAAWGSHEQSMNFRKWLMMNGGVSAPEYYLREKASEGEARFYIDFMFDYLRAWEKRTPGSLPSILMVLSCTDGLPGYYGQDTMANVNYKVFLDMQYNMLANAEEFDGLRGIAQWILRYARPDTIAWLAMLNRHYCIEGRTSMLSDEMGYTFGLTHLANPDFKDGTSAWELTPAADGSLFLDTVKGWGFGRGTCNTAPDGDAVIVMKRVPGKTNTLRQNVTGLVPGQWYELRVRVADMDDVLNGRSIRKLLPLNAVLDGVTFDSELSAIDVYQSDHPLPPKYPKNNNGPCANELQLVFKATAPSTTLTLSDDRSTIGIRAGNYVSAPFTIPKSEDVPAMMLNFIQLQPVLPPGQWK